LFFFLIFIRNRNSRYWEQTNTVTGETN
jgi:hypothetical protein